MQETPETRAKLAGAIKDLQYKGDTQSIATLVGAYKQKYQTQPQSLREIATSGQQIDFNNQLGGLLQEQGGKFISNLKKTKSGQFGETIGETLGAPQAIKQYNEAFKSFEDVNNNIISAIKNAQKTGQDTTRLEELLKLQQERAPKLDDFLGNKVGELVNMPSGQSTKKVLGEAFGTLGEATAGGGLSGVGKLSGIATLATKPTLRVAAESVISQLPSAISSDIGKSLEAGKFETPVNTILSTVTPFGIAGLGRGVSAIKKLGNFASLSEAQNVVDDVSKNLETLVGTGQVAEKRLAKFRRNGTPRFLLENGFIPEVKDGRIFTDTAREKIQTGIKNIAEEVSQRADNDPTLFGKTSILSGLRGAIDKSGDVMGTALPEQKDFITKEAQVFLNQIDQTGERVSTKGVLRLRQYLDGLASETFDPIKKQYSAKGLAARNASDYLRTVVRESTQDESIGNLLKLEGELHSADEFLSPKGIGGKTIKGGRLGQYLARLGGGIAAMTVSGGGVTGLISGAVGQEVAGQTAKALGKLQIIGPIQKLKLSRLTNSVLDLIESNKLDDAVAQRIKQKAANKTAQEVADIIEKEAPDQLGVFTRAVNEIAVKRYGVKK